MDGESGTTLGALGGIKWLSFIQRGSASGEGRFWCEVLLSRYASLCGISDILTGQVRLYYAHA